MIKDELLPYRRVERQLFLDHLASAPEQGFTFVVRRIGVELRARMGASWRPGCPVPLAELRHLEVGYVDFAGRVRTGELVVHRDAVVAMRRAFERMFRARFPIRSMRLVDDFGGDDAASMAADNTSAFNCRRATGASSWSAHAFGRAIDINPRENPYVAGSVVLPSAGRRFLDRGRAMPGLISADGPTVAGFAASGWVWGGTYRSVKDYQHFSADGR